MPRLGHVVVLLVPFMLVACLQWFGSPVHTGGVRTHDARRTLLETRRLAKQLASQQAKQPQPPKPAVVEETQPATQTAASTAAATTAAATPPAAEAAPAIQAAEAAAATEGAYLAKKSTGACPGRKPYHTLLTATGQVYQQWQCRVMYFHWKKQRDADPKGACTELTGFTRLVASAGGRPDGLEREIPSAFVSEYTPQETSRFHGYRVVNRPYSVVQFLKTEAWRAIREEYLYIAETDHLLMHVIPNTATRGSPMAYVFNYMGPNPAHAKIIRNAWPNGGDQGWRSVQSIGPSPVVIHKADLEAVATPWNTLSVQLKTTPEADQRLGWVIEMWGYAIAAASIGLVHQEFRNFQVEPGGNSGGSQLQDFATKYWVFHYTYQFEYMLDGTPCKPWTIGMACAWTDGRRRGGSAPRTTRALPDTTARHGVPSHSRGCTEPLGSLLAATPPP